MKTLTIIGIVLTVTLSFAIGEFIGKGFHMIFGYEVFDILASIGIRYETVELYFGRAFGIIGSFLGFFFFKKFIENAKKPVLLVYSVILIALHATPLQFMYVTNIETFENETTRIED